MDVLVSGWAVIKRRDEGFSPYRLTYTISGDTGVLVDKNVAFFDGGIADQNSPTMINYSLS